MSAKAALRGRREGSLVVFIAVTRATRVKVLLYLSIATLLLVFQFGSESLGIRPVAGKLKPVARVDTQRRVVALTFDVTYGEKSPVEVLDALKALGVKCTFFLAAPWAMAHPDTVKRIVRDGHELGSQGYWHENLSTASDERIMESLNKAHTALTGIAGKEPSLFRPPNGDYDDRVIETALEVGYSTITFSLDSFDWRTEDETYIAKRVSGKSKQGDIVRLHAGDLSRSTARALPRIVDELKKRDLVVVTVGELIRSSSNTMSLHIDRTWH